MTMKMSPGQINLLQVIAASDKRTTMTPKDIREYADANGIERLYAGQVTRAAAKVSRGLYDLSPQMKLAVDNTIDQPSEPMPTTDTSTTKAPTPMNQDPASENGAYVPEKDQHFVRWGNYKDIEAIVKSRMFYPSYITGLSGNGKTMMVEQACAKLGREYVRVQITPETDEDDLIGGFRLVNGDTVFSKGPVIRAMEAGAVLLVDEIDRGSNKMMALQGILEGKPVVIKKTGEVIKPQPGFNIIATANTKGQGSEDGRFVAATIIDDAFLERFIITMEQPYPTLATERKIVNKHMEKFGVNDSDFTETLVTWAETIRKTYEDEGIDETISTRRICHIVQTYSIFSDKSKAIRLCVNRFDEDTRDAFLDLYSKVDATVGDTSSGDQTQTADDVIGSELSSGDSNPA